jgi:branched-chain amino acid transport system substrate-binding protein
MAPNYQAGRDSLAGFKRHFKGEIVDEVYTQLGQLDFSAELAKIAAAKPDVFFVFMPGGMGVNLVKQYRQAGLADKCPSSRPSRWTNPPCRPSRMPPSASSPA